ncbi:MAG: lyase family protein [Candidatus Falkowbacteria bacterium]
MPKEPMKATDASGVKTNWQMPGNPRYQPNALKPFFGYDELYGYIGRVEYAALEELIEILISAGLVPEEAREQLNEDTYNLLSNIVTSEVDRYEREVTKHDIRAFVQIAQAKLPPQIKQYLHVMLTSYDPIDTAAALRFKLAYQNVLSPEIGKLVKHLVELAEQYKAQIQIGRTHGQHALPITVGFWLSTIINRLIYNWEKMDSASDELVGKISGAVGAMNAYVGLGLDEYESAEEFEIKVLGRLELQPALITTQIVPPEPLAYFLFSVTMMTAAIAQFGNDCRQLMRTEIGEIQEEFVEGQVGSSTMAHKRNPIIFENLVGTWKKTKVEFMKVFETLISEHQRDLTDSSVMRDFPTIVINLQLQLDNLLRENKDGVPFIKRIVVNNENLQKNFELQKNYILAEPIYVALQLYGYTGDAHKLVNETLMGKAQALNISLYEALTLESSLNDMELVEVLTKIPQEIRQLFAHPENYTGAAERKTEFVIEAAKEFLDFLGYSTEK